MSTANTKTGSRKSAAGSPPRELITAGSIARKHGQPGGRVQQAIRNLDLKEAAIAGRTRVFTNVDEGLIVQECRMMASQARKRAARRGTRS